MNAEKNENTSNSQKRRPTSKWLLIGSIVALLCFIAASTQSTIRKWFARKTGTAVTLKRQFDLDDFKRSVQSLRKKHDAENLALFEQFRRDIATAGDADFQKALNNIDGTVNYFGKFKTCGGLIWAMARDKVKGTESAQEIINSVIKSNVVDPCAAGTADAVDVLRIFVHRLQENNNRFRAEMALELEKLPHDDSDIAAAKKLMNDLGDFSSQVDNLAIETAFTAAGTAIEAIFIRQTVGAVVRLAGGTIAKLAGSAAAPLLDGPLPIGDILAVGGFAWCTYDIYRIMKVLPERMSASLHAAIKDYRANLRKELLESGRKAWLAANNSSEKTVANIR